MVQKSIDVTTSFTFFSDFGMDPLNDLVKGTNFPWLISNVIDKETNRPLGEGKISHVIKRGHFKIGLVSVQEMILITHILDILILFEHYTEPHFCFIR